MKDEEVCTTQPTVWVTLTKLGGWFDMTAVAVGKVLVGRGLKDKAGATPKALIGGYAKEARTRGDIDFFLWDAGKVAAIIDLTLGGDKPTPFLDRLVAQVGESIAEAQKHRGEGNDFLAELILDRANEGVPPGLVRVINERLGESASTPAVLERETVNTQGGNLGCLDPYRRQHAD